MNIASVPCRCGHSWTVPGIGRAGSGPGSSGGRVLEHRVERVRRPRLNDLGRLGQHRRAGRVEHDPPGADRGRGRPDQRPLEQHQADQVVGLAPPARLRAPPQRPQPGARRVDEDPVEGPGPPRRPGAVRGDDAEGAVGAGEGPRHEPGPVRLPFAGDQAGAPLGRRAPPAAPPCRPVRRTGRARSRRRRRPGRRPAPSATSCDPSSWTPARPSATAGIAPGSPPSRTVPYGDHGVGSPGELVAVGPSGPRHQRDPGRLVVGGQQVVQLGPADRVAQLLDDPLRVAVGDRREPRRRGQRIGGDPDDPLVEVVRGDLAQDGVGEAGRPGADPGPDQVHGRADRGVRRHPHREQLVDAEPQRVEHLGLHLAERPVHAGGEDRVVRAAPADRPRHQLGDERGVPAGQPVLAQDRGQHEVGVGVVDADGLEHVHRRQRGGPRSTGRGRGACRARPAGCGSAIARGTSSRAFEVPSPPTRR